ncbi:hypothetical protein BDZ97DRAFT_1662417 [Flammula alnicola]|nr:hypothetical protein BDZ97DRAFT_1662417 [Flammula alnicola]
MDENAHSFSPSYNQPESPKIYLPKPSGSGLTLVIPSLKSLKATQTQNPLKSAKRRSGSLSQSGSVFQDVDNQEKKIPRPVKLKPLKEVLSKLIGQLKKKDDYAFFLHPVDVTNVPGYSDIVKHPMDLGTMTDKVNRGKYRSLEDFASDFRLVTMNAKIFNPPGSIYYTEADRLEVWGLDHISKAASTVIQYETDWNIEIEKDDEGPSVNVDDDEEYMAGTPMDVDGTSLRERSVSVASQPQPGPSRRGPRGPYKKHGQSAPGSSLSEMLELDGGLPGSKDGLGSFPAGSDWAKTMVALKLKGKRYKTKKERLRIEREGPPLLADGSLDYTEMEDPFSILSFFVPDSPSRPHLVPLYPPLYNAPSDPSSSQNQTPLPAPPTFTFPSATSIPLDHASPTLPFLQPIDSAGKQPPRRHWTIARNATWRQKGKEKEDEQEARAAELPAWQMPREAHATDFGSFAVLAGELAEEMRRRGLTSVEREDMDQELNMDLIRERLDCESTAKKLGVEKAKKNLSHLNGMDLLANGYWTSQRAAEAEDYIRDLVYGGVDGFAYVRSLAEFVDGECYHKDVCVSVSREPSTPPHDASTQYSGLGMPLAKWVETNIVDPLTDGRHSLLRETALELARQQKSKSQLSTADLRQGTVASQVAASLHIYPSALVALSALLHIRLHKIDMGSLIKTPDELFLSEEEWIGKSLKEQRKNKVLAKLEAEAAAAAAAAAVPDGAMEVEEPEQTWAGVDASLVKEHLNGRLNAYEQEGPEELSEVLEYVANVIVELARRNKAEKARSDVLPRIPTSDGARASDTVPGGISSPMTDQKDGRDSTPNLKMEEYSSSSEQPQPKQQAPPPSPTEDPAIRNLRLNLLALAKRAPLDTIARLPKDLVPEHIRHFVPTLGSTG